MISIDGSQGEGGGQIIRSSLALSALTGCPFEVRDIRGRRKKPGLLRQHLTAVNATASICNANVSGNQLNSSHLLFEPGPVCPGEYRFSIGSAGSATLVAQTILPALMVQNGPSTVVIEGGTHNMAAPPYDFLEKVYLPLVRRMGPNITSAIERWGFYPAGGGRVKFGVRPSALSGLVVLDKQGPMVPSVTALVSQLPESIGEREVDIIRRRGGWKQKHCLVRMIESSPGPGNCVMIQLDHENISALFTGFGRKGVTAERVAKTAWRQASAWIDQSAPVGEYLCDQLLLPMAIAASQGQTSRFRTSALSGHSLTQIEIIGKFLKIEIDLGDFDGTQKEICVKPTASA